MEMNIRYIFVLSIISSWEISVTPIRFKYIEEAEILSRVTNDTNDPCLRECVTGKNMQCLYTFIVESDTSMGVRCKNCPYKESDCSLPGCVPGGGIQRPLVTVNRRTPGPDIQVCEGDTVIVDVINALKMEGLTIHWHGIHQVNTPYMDGTPYITQCPVLPYNKFRYQFVASPAGTHMWHGHVAFQESDGLYGKLIVRRQEEENFKKLYDFDLPEHSIAVWHWYDWSTQGILEKILHINGSVFGYGLLINGKGVLKEFKNSDLMFNVHATPREIFYVTQGRRYLFRTMTNSAIYCPIQVSIDHHTMFMVATDTSNFEPVEVDSFMMSAGERFNFILYANQREGCYWMRFRGIGDCGEMKSSTHQEAYVCYHGSRPTRFPYERPTYDEGRRSGILLNPVEIVDAKYENNSLIHVNELKSMEPLEVNVSGKPNVTLYIQLHNQIYDLNFPGPWPQFNNITFEFPEKPLLSQGHELQSESLCTAETGKNFCVRGYCQCPYVEEIPLDSLVEMVLVDISVNRQQDHPIHLHGFQFYIVAMEAVGYNVSFENIKERNEKGEIRKNFISVPGKDTLSVPNKGFSVIRFIASNPGYWLFHCHVSNHMELGMAMVLKVGEKSQMSKIPNNFPQCGNWVFMPENPGGNASSFVPLFWVVLICLISTIKLI